MIVEGISPMRQTVRGLPTAVPTIGATAPNDANHLPTALPTAVPTDLQIFECRLPTIGALSKESPMVFGTVPRSILRRLGSRRWLPASRNESDTQADLVGGEGIPVIGSARLVAGRGSREAGS